MSASDDDGGPGRREIAHRLFAAEFDDADFSYSESDEERAPNYVITPSGARVNRLFLVGVLTETEWVNDEMLRARIVDPTGPFVSYAGQYQPDALGFLERADPPAFLAVTGKARTFQPEDGDRVFTSVRPESISEVDADTRDRWVVEAAKRTVHRVETMAAAMETGLTGDELVAALEADGVDSTLASGIALALDHYGTTPAYLEALRRLAEDALEMVAGERDEVRPLDVAPDEGDGDASALAGDTAISAGPAAAEQSPGESSGAEPATGASATDEPATTADAASADDTSAAASEPTDASKGDVAAASADDAADGEDTAGAASAAAAGEEIDETDELGDFDADDDLGDFDPEEDDALTEAERREVEAEFDTEFSTGNEVDAEPELTPEEQSDSAAEDAPTPAAEEGQADSDDTTAADATTDESSDATDTTDESSDDAGEPAEDVSLDDAVMGAMGELDDGDGAAHDELVATVRERTGADADAVEDAIEDALMSGRCYEPDDGVLKPI